MLLTWYHASISQIAAQPDCLAKKVLNAEEHARYLGMRASHRQAQFLVARWLIHQMLSKEFAIPFGSAYQRGAHSSWTSLPSQQTFQVSISHSRDIVVVALSDGPEPIGVDVEWGKPRDFHALSETCMSQSERAVLSDAPTPQSVAQLFYQRWTLKEAYFKQSQQEMTTIFQTDIFRLLPQIQLDSIVTQSEGYFYALVFTADPDLAPVSSPRSVVE